MVFSMQNYIGYYNELNNQKVQLISSYASQLDFSKISHDELKMACGPVTLFSSLKALNKIKQDTPVSQFYHHMHDIGQLNYDTGMNVNQLSQALTQYSLHPIIYHYYNTENAMTQIAQDLENNHLVFMVVRAETSYHVLTHKILPVTGHHLIQIVGLQKDKSGHVTSFAVYDVNAFLTDKNIKYIPCEDLQTIVAPSIKDESNKLHGIFLTAHI